jgi:predicted phage terminase large subunit-like protein
MNVHQPIASSYTNQDEQLIAEFYAAEARENLWAFRKYMDPNMKTGWWARQVSGHFQRFYLRLKNGHRPKMLLMAPPQHGKSRGVQDLLAWVHGHEPDWKSIFASFSSDLGITANSVLQRMLEDDKYRLAFPDTQISPLSGGKHSGRYQRNSTLLEFVEHAGSFRNTTVDGQINGKTLNLGVVDDPMKGRAEASSQQMRDKAWNWLMDDFLSRFTDDAGMIMTMTRWHLDDPGGRFLERFPDTQVLRYPAMATARSIKDNHEPREVDEVLFPEFKSREFILERKGAYTAASWESLYQQSPIVAGGGMFPVERFVIVPAFNRRDIVKSVRYWDKAGTRDGGAFTAGVLMHQMKDGNYLIEDVIRGQWDHYTRENRIKQTAEMDDANRRTEVWVEQEPGSGGLESAERTIANLSGHLVFKDPVKGDKEMRAEPYASQVQGGNVQLLRKQWNKTFIDEHEAFPSGRYKDQVDSAAGAFAKLVVKKYKYDTSLSWV